MEIHLIKQTGKLRKPLIKKIRQINYLEICYFHEVFAKKNKSKSKFPKSRIFRQINFLYEEVTKELISRKNDVIAF